MADFYQTGIDKVARRGGLLRLLVRIFPQHLITQIKFELHMLAVRLRRFSQGRGFAGRTDIMLNIGAGDCGLDGWVNMDAFKCKGVNCLWDPRDKLPFDDNSVKGIFSEHFFEHIHYTEEAPGFLRECYRVLQPGGVLRIIVPDAGRYLNAYASADAWAELTELRPLERQDQTQDGTDRVDPYFGWTYNTPMELMNAVFRQSQEHKFAYDAETLMFVMQKNGFATVKQQTYQQSELPELAIDQASRKTESLYVEGIK